jgi:hypothetical protein
MRPNRSDSQYTLLPYGFSVSPNHGNYQIRLGFYVRLNICLHPFDDVYSRNTLFERCDGHGEWQAVAEEAQGEENAEQPELDAGDDGPENSHDWVNRPEFILEAVYARFRIDRCSHLEK